MRSCGMRMDGWPPSSSSRAVTSPSMRHREQNSALWLMVGGVPDVYPHFSDFAAPPERLFSVSEVAAELGLSRIATSMLVLSGLGGPAHRLEPRSSALSVLAPASTVHELQGYEPLADVAHEEAFVVRVRPARESFPHEERPLVGWMPMWQWKGCPYAEAHQTVTPDVGYRTDMDRAVGGWWPAAAPESWLGKPLVATIAGYVVYCARITHFTRAENGPDVAFDLESDLEVTATFSGRFMPPTRGGNVVHLPANTLPGGD